MWSIQIPVCYPICTKHLWSCLTRGEMNWQMITPPRVGLPIPCKFGTVACGYEVNCTTPHIWPAKLSGTIIERNSAKTRSTVKQGITSGVSVGVVLNSMASVKIGTDYNSPWECPSMSKFAKVSGVTKPRSNIFRQSFSRCRPKFDGDSLIFDRVQRYAI